MDQVHVIRHKVLVEGRSCRSVAEELGVSRNTVRKYVAQSEPIRQSKAKRERPVFDKVCSRLEELWEEWRQRTTKKQRLTIRRLHRQLLEEGYEVGITTVGTFVRAKRREQAEVFVPLVHRAGDEAQVDFFEVTVMIKGVLTKVWMFVLRLMYSGRDFAWLYERCDQVSFLDGHMRAFNHLDGVPARVIYDNLKAAVVRVLRSGRELSPRFMALASHYLFEPCFARPGTGHDKGGIEGRGKTIRYQHLVPIPEGESLKAISEELLANLDRQSQHKKNIEGRTVAARFAEEQPLLRPLPARPFEPRLAVPLSVSRKALVRHAGAVYSVPSHWNRLDVMAYVGPCDIRFVCRDEIIVRERVGRRKKNIHYKDYLVELSRKPQAVRQVAPELLGAMSEPFSELWKMLEETHGGKQAGRIFSKVLAAIVEHGEAAVTEALRKTLSADKGHLLALGSLMREPLPASVSVPESLQSYIVESARAADFDWLLNEQEVAQ